MNSAIWPKRLFHALVGLAVLWVMGLIWFVYSINRYQMTESEASADAIVVLAGGAGRIAAGIELLHSGHGRRLLISGVDPNIDSDVIFAAIGDQDADIECCIDLGRAALDTSGNANEALTWAQNLGFHSLIVVTADYHMPRSLMEFRCRASEVRIVPQPVRSERKIQTLALEYAKYTMRLLMPCEFWN